MVAKCPKCEATEFSIVKREDKMFCYVACKKCETIVGVLEDIDFNERHNIIIANEQGIDRHITQLEMKVESLAKENKELREITENTNAIVCQISKKIR